MWFLNRKLITLGSKWELCSIPGVIRQIKDILENWKYALTYLLVKSEWNIALFWVAGVVCKAYGPTCWQNLLLHPISFSFKMIYSDAPESYFIEIYHNAYCNILVWLQQKKLFSIIISVRLYSYLLLMSLNKCEDEMFSKEVRSLMAEGGKSL